MSGTVPRNSSPTHTDLPALPSRGCTASPATNTVSTAPASSMRGQPAPPVQASSVATTSSPTNRSATPTLSHQDADQRGGWSVVVVTPPR